ncbi:MAG: ParB/RepB/Spo0J family partition protein [Acidobacteriaceae bacterium]
MTATVEMQSEYRNLPILNLTESPANPRRTFDETALNELAESIRTQGVLSPLLVRPKGHSYEIVAGARRYRAAQRAGLDSVPVRIVELTDAQALETSIVENLQRRDVHPLDEATGYVSLLHLDYTVEQIAAKCGKNPSYVAARARLAQLAPAVTEAFAKDDIGVGHALLLARLQAEQQEEALTACYQEAYTNGSKAKRILLPVRHLQQWIEHNILLELAAAPFSKEDAQLVPEAGSCVDCPKRTGHNALLFAEIGANQPDSCSDPKCYTAKIDAHVKQTVATKPKLVQISTAYGQPKDGSAAIPRNKYVEIRQDKPQRKNERDLPEYKSCKYTAEAIVTEGTEKGETKRVCANPECPVHHPKKQHQRNHADAAFKAEQQKHRREEALAQATGLRVLKAIGDAVPVRLMKRDLLFVAERFTAMLEERSLSVLIRQHGIGKPKNDAPPAKMLAAFLPKAEESKLGRILVETAILLSVHNQTDAAKVLRDAAHAYKVDVDAISSTVKQEFAAKDKGKAGKKATLKSVPKPAKKAAA